jgi:two-component system chemotaxis response regulator CheB
VLIQILLVDDSAVIRGLISKALSMDPELTICGTAANGAIAIDMAKTLQPHIIILDIEMPVMDGITALPELLKASPRSKIIVASTLTLRNAEISLKALERGATDYLAKPSAKTGADAEHFYQELIQKVKVLGQLSAKMAPPAPPAAPSASRTAPSAPAAPAAVAAPKPAAAPAVATPITAAPVPRPAPVVLASSSATPLHKTGIAALAIASSTGGPQALLTVFGHLRGALKHMPIFITQHMPPTFTTILADHISKAGERVCIEAKGGEQAEPGKAYLAPGDYHMIAERTGAGVVLRLNQDAPENFCRPSADPMLRSLVAAYGNKLALLVLTGMGQDGLEGAKLLVSAGGSVIAQNEESCVVYGMPRAVVDNQLCRAVLPLDEIGAYLKTQLENPYAPR